MSARLLAIGLLCAFPGLSWAGLHCDINTGGAAPFSPYTRENPIAVDQDTEDYTVILSLDYAQFLPNMRLTCSTDGQDVAAPASFDGSITVSLSAVNDTALDWAGEANTANNGIKMKMYIKAVSYNDETLPNSYPPARLEPGKQLGTEYAIMQGKADTTLFQFGAQYNADKSLYQFDEKHNYAIEAMRVILIKYGWIDYSPLPVIPAGTHLTFTIDGMSGISTIDVPLGSGVYMAAPSCKLDTAHQVVELEDYVKQTAGNFPLEGQHKHFGIGYTCSSYTNNVELTFEDANTPLKGHNALVANTSSGGQEINGLEVRLYNSEGKIVTMEAKQSLGVAQKGPNTAYFDAAVVQTTPNISAPIAPYTGNFTAKANVTISYY